MKHLFWPVLLCVLAALLILPRLGQRTLWGDEAETAIYAQRILEHGVPLVYSDRWLSSYWDTVANDSLVNVYAPWLQFYVTAAALAIFGATTWAARFPFALAAIATIPCLYFYVLRLSKDKTLAILSAVFCLSGLTFLLFARQSRYYSLVMLLTVLVCWAELNLSSGKIRSLVLFAVPAALLFYSHQLIYVTLMVGLGVAILLFERNRNKLISFGLAAGFSALLAIPWLLLAHGLPPSPGTALWTRIHDGLFTAVLSVRDYAAVGLLPVTMYPLIAVALWRSRPLRRPIGKLLVVVAVITLMTSLAAPTGNASSIRYQLSVVPLLAVIVAAGCVFVWRGKRWVAAALFMLLIGTTFLWQPFSDALCLIGVEPSAIGRNFAPQPLIIPNALCWHPYTAFQNDPLARRTYSRWIPLANYFGEITHDVDDPIGQTAAYLNANAQPGQLASVLPPMIPESLCFLTPLRYCVFQHIDKFKHDPAVLRKVPVDLWKPTADIEWLIDFSGQIGESQGFTLPQLGPSASYRRAIVFDVSGLSDYLRPELWYHSFRTVRLDPKDEKQPTIYRRSR